MAGVSKANQRQSTRRKGRYAAQRDVTPVNKAINVARHIARYGDTKQKDVLRKLPKTTLAQAARKLYDRGAGLKHEKSTGFSLASQARNVLLGLS